MFNEAVNNISLFISSDIIVSSLELLGHNQPESDCTQWSSATSRHRYDMTEILLKVTLNRITHTHTITPTMNMINNTPVCAQGVGPVTKIT